MVAKAAAGSEAEAAAADATGDTASGQKTEPTAWKGPSAARKAPALTQKAAAAVHKCAAADKKALSDADPAMGSDVALLAEPNNVAVSDAKLIAAVKAATGASKAIFWGIIATSPSAFSLLTLEDKTTDSTDSKSNLCISSMVCVHKTHIGGLVCPS